MTDCSLLPQFEKISEDMRLDFIPSYFSDPIGLALFDTMVFNFADAMIEGYSGAYWVFYRVKLANGSHAPLMVPRLRNSSEGINLLQPFSGDTFRFTDEKGLLIAGMIVCSYALNQLFRRIQPHCTDEVEEQIADYIDTLNAAIYATAEGDAEIEQAVFNFLD